MQTNRRDWLRTSSAMAAATVLTSRAAHGQTTPNAPPTVDNPPGTVATGHRHAVATVHELASRAAMNTFAQGGNAADAAVAAGLMLAVVDGHNSGIGGGCFILARSADGNITAIDGREMAPAASHPKMYFRGDTPDPNLSQIGPMAAGVPGAVAAYHELSKTLGTGRWHDACTAAAEVAQRGYRVSTAQADRLRSVRDQIARFPATSAIFQHASGVPFAPGDTLVQSDLAKTLRELADGGPDAFYRGRFAESTAKWMRNHGGLLTTEDFANYHTVSRTPVRTSFLGHQIIGFPPPSSGGIHVAQILALLERFDLADIATNQPASYYHLVAEAMRLAFADRAVFLGDPDFANVPKGLLDPDYLRSRGAPMATNQRLRDVRAGMPPRSGTDLFGKGTRERHTTHFTTADHLGNWVAITATINTTLGSKVVIPGTGVVLNNEMDDFAIAPGVPNAFGLVGNKANAPQPGKRPLSSMSPSIATKDGQPIITCGAAGGPRIISATAQILLRHLACQLPLPQAIAAPRVHHQWRPDVLRVEQTVDQATVTQLEQLGHTVTRIGAVATAQSIARTPQGELVAAAEPRLPGTALAD